MKFDQLGCEAARNLYAKAMGDLVVTYVDALEPDKLHSMAESEAWKLIAKIKTILDEDDVSDKECFYRIDKIIKAFDEVGLYTNRHDW